MNYTEHKITLDIQKTVSVVSLSVKKGDTGRRLSIHLTESGYPYHISSDCYVVFTALKPDGHVVFNNCFIKDRAIIYDITAQTVAAVGLVACEIILYGADAKQLTSASFNIIVEDTVYDTEKEIESTDEFNALADLIAKVQRIYGDGPVAPAIVCDAKGALIRLTDASNMAFPRLRIFGKSTQDGTPTPANPVEIVNIGAGGSIGLYVAGKNLFANSETHAVDATGAEVNNGAARRTPYIPVRPGQKLAFSKSEALPADAEPNGMLRMYDENRQFVSSMGAIGYAGLTKVVTIPDGIYFVRFVQYGFTYIDGLEVQMEFASTVTDYDGTAGQTVTIATPNGLAGIPVSVGGNYTDGDGQQWICDEIDLARKVYIQRIGKINLMMITSWTRGTGNGWANASAFYASNAIPKAVVIDGYETKANLLCNRLVIGTASKIAGRTVNSVGQGTGTSLYVSIEGIETAADLIKYFLENKTVVQYVLAEPIETELTDKDIAALHTNKPNTVIYNDAGAYMDAEYVADTKTYVSRNGGGGAGGSSVTIGSVTLLAAAWKGNAAPYSQVVNIAGVTEYSQVDLIPSVEQLTVFHNKDLAFVTENDGGVVTVYSIGDKPQNDYTMQVSITEVNV